MPTDRSETDAATVAAGYAGAVDHYTSPSRRDAVKRVWEEPELVALLDDAVRRTRPDGALRVADVGCGTGVGLALLRSTPRRRAAGAPPLHYLGVDLDEALLRVAGEQHADDADVRFVRADIRDGLPDGPHDLVMSSGVPFSHLTPDELEAVLADIFAAARTAAAPTVVVVDVLGRYSIEWTSRWQDRRWSYRMSFFRSDVDPAATDMTVHGGAELRELIARAATRAGGVRADVTLRDRSIMVGRHTSTGEYTPGLRPYRDLVNGLFAPDVEVAFDDLLLDVALPDAPADVLAFLGTFAASWNATVRRARQAAVGREPTVVASELQPALAQQLYALETSMQRGLGVGHSLTATVVTRPAG